MAERLVIIGLNFALQAQKVTGAFETGHIDTLTYAKMMVALQEEMDLSSKEIEKERLKIRLQKEGIDSLGTDGKGFRTNAQLADLPFATGTASVCLAVAIVDKSLGMAAAHKNPFAPQINGVFFEEEATPQNIGSILARQSRPLIEGDRLETFVAYTTLEALGEYQQLRTSGSPRHLEVLATGMDMLRQDQKHIVQRTLTRTLTSGIQEVYGRLPYRININVRTNIGSVGGYVYGGKFKTPALYR